MAELVRVAVLTGYFSVARQLGLDPQSQLRAAGLTRSMLLNPEQLIPARSAVRLLEASAEASGCQTFGLRMAARRGLADLGMVSLLIAHQPTLREALAVLGRYRNQVNSTLVLSIEEHDEAVILREEFSLDLPNASRQASDLALGVLTLICGSVLGPQWHPECACFRYPRPDAPEMELYWKLFRCRIEFNSEFNGIVLNARDLDRLNPRADSALASHAGTLIDIVTEPGQHTLAQVVEQTILLLLPNGHLSIKVAAASIGMNVRTMQRGLDAEGTSFSEMLDRVRARLVAQHLANRRLRLTDIADLLGYSSLGAFTRWYSQTFNETPSTSRKRALAETRRDLQSLSSA